MITTGQIVKENEKGFYVFVPCVNHKDEMRAAKDVLIEIPDPRKISGAQRRKIFVLLGYISAWWSYTPIEATKELMKLMFRGQAEYKIFDKNFSLSNCDMTTAKLFITYLIDFCILHNVEIGEPLGGLCEDIPHYIWACLMNKRCAVCGAKADLHHVERVGMGRNRKKINHINMLVLPLCRKHHTECHAMPQDDFNKLHCLTPIALTPQIGKVYNLSKKNIDTGEIETFKQGDK